MTKKTREKRILNLIKIRQRFQIKRLNKVLDIKLKDWQIDLIFNNNDSYGYKPRAAGQTTARILWLLFSKEGRPLVYYPRSKMFNSSSKDFVKKFAGEDYIDHQRETFFNSYLMEIYSKIKEWNKIHPHRQIKIRDIQIAH